MTSSRTEFNSVRNASIRQNWSVNQNMTAYKTAASVGPVAKIVLGAILVAFIALIYLAQIVQSGGFDYSLSQVEDKKTELLAEKQDLQVENARLQALATVKNSTVASTMGDPVSVDTQN